MASNFRPAVFLGLITVLPLTGGSTPPDKFEGLRKNPPFGPAPANVAVGSVAGTPVEFRAVLEEGGSRFFSLYDTVTRRSNWVNLDDPANGFSVKEYDETNLSITLEYQGRLLTLPLTRSRVMTTAAAPAPAVTVPPPGGQSQYDPAKLQRMREEYRRKKALQDPNAKTPGTPSTPGQP